MATCFQCGTGSLLPVCPPGLPKPGTNSSIPNAGEFRSASDHKVSTDSHHWPDLAERRNAMVIDHLPMVKAIAARFRLKLPLHLELNDLVQAGIVGLLEAAHRYDPGTENCFSTYATHRIKGAILDSLRGQDPASRKLRKAHRMNWRVLRVPSPRNSTVPRRKVNSQSEAAMPLSRLRKGDRAGRPHTEPHERSGKTSSIGIRFAAAGAPMNSRGRRLTKILGPEFSKKLSPSCRNRTA